MTLQREKSRVVVIDDDPILRESLKRFLKTADTDVDVFEDAETALLEMDDGVEVVLLDLFLPGQHGLQCLKLLRRQYPETRVIVVSSSTDHRDIVDAIQGAQKTFCRSPSTRRPLFRLLYEHRTPANTATTHQPVKGRAVERLCSGQSSLKRWIEQHH